MNKMPYHIKDLVERKEGFAIAKIIDTDGSAPRKSGAIMMLTQNGKFSGTVGGGKIEKVVQEHCKEAIISKEKEKVYNFKLNTTEKDALDMGCGGEASVVVKYVDETNAQEVLSWFELNSTAYIFGAGHVGLALEPILRHIDFNTVVVDDREEFANRERFPLATEVKVIENFKKTFEDITCDENSYIIIVTRGHMGDYDVLKDALKEKNAYLGMIGSKSKTALLYDMLREDGVSQEQLDKVYAPIGENIFAETPEEISISIAAEMIKVRSGHGSR